MNRVNFLAGTSLLSMVLAAGCQAESAMVEGEVDSLGRELGSVSGAILAANPDNDRVLGLVARVEVQRNELLEFFEPRAGLLLVVRSGAPDGPSPIDSGDRQLSPQELWGRATGGLPIPAGLEAAIARSYPGGDPGRSSAAGGEPVHRVASEIGPHLAQPGEPGYCDTTWRSTPARSACSPLDYTVCLDDWFNGAFAEHRDCWQVITEVCAASGPVLFRVQTDDDSWPGTTQTVLADTFANYQVHDGSCRLPSGDCPDVRADVLNAEGDRFHFRFLANTE